METRSDCEQDHNIDDANAARRHWMSVLARAPADRLSRLWSAVVDVGQLDVEDLRGPETGLVMVRGRAGGSGDPFNLGEMTVTRCSVRMAGHVGHAYVAGRDHAHARVAACLDALLQNEDHAPRLMDEIIAPLEREAEVRAAARRRDVGATKVDFLTMVREEGE